MDKELIRLYARLELARRDFWTFCKLKAPDFYKEDRGFLKDLCNTLQEFYEGEKKILVINMPPRFGKSRTATLFCQWVLGRNPRHKVMTGSYNEMLSTTFAKSVRDSIGEEKTQGVLSYSDIFPNTSIKRGESSANKWALEGSQQANYLATSPNGTATGFGCDIMVIDDLIKLAEEAYNENVKRKHIEWFNNTMLSRTEKGFKIIIIMTRWATDDLAGYILDHFEDVEHVNYKAMNDDGTMLCEDILSRADFDFKTQDMNKDIILANYQQEPINVKGRLYTHFKTYTDIPRDEDGKSLFEYVLNYTDTADTGADFLCSICYGMYNNSYYIIDIFYSKEPMEVTEPETARMLTRNNVGCAIIESNNGGRGFARNVERECREKGNYHTTFKWLHQTQNKKARIMSNSASVMNNVYFPIDWQTRFQDFATDILKYQKEGTNAHDDAPDALTGVYENPKPRGQHKMNMNIRGGI